MLCPVENENISIRTHRSNNIRFLWHVSCFVDLRRMRHLLLYGQTTLRAASIAANLFSVFVVVAGVVLGWGIRNVDFTDLEVVVVVAGGVCADKQTVGGVVLVWMAMKAVSSSGGRPKSGSLTIAYRETIAW